MIKVEWFYWLCAVVFLIVALLRACDAQDRKRWGSAAFWAILAFTFGYGSFVVAKTASPFMEGIAVLALAVLAGFGFPGGGTTRTTSDAERGSLAERFGGTLFVPALLIPVVAVLFGALLKKVHLGGRPLLEEGSETVIGLGVGAIVALVVGLALFRVRDVSVPFREGDRLLGHIGWASILPQFLATLGALFAAAGVGDAVAKVTDAILPSGVLVLAIIVYCLGMALFTVIMGNAFAAFPVMVAAVGWPVLIQHYDGNPAVVFAVGMLAGFCGTLCTPMAANFNLVPAALLELKDQYGPIKAQLATAAPLWVCNVVIIWIFAF